MSTLLKKAVEQFNLEFNSNVHLEDVEIDMNNKSHSCNSKLNGGCNQKFIVKKTGIARKRKAAKMREHKKHDLTLRRKAMKSTADDLLKKVAITEKMKKEKLKLAVHYNNILDNATKELSASIAEKRNSMLAKKKDIKQHSLSVNKKDSCFTTLDFKRFNADLYKIMAGSQDDEEF